ncbi:MAG: hypothetical protein KF716_21860 [Anaerolineae bacterium]|nr:hypothetical protein [Anaerolineae bacterium]
MKRLLVLILLLAFLASFTITIARTLGAARPADPASFVAMLNRDLRLIDGAWCWRGLCPGLTTAEQVKVTLTDGITGRNHRGDVGPSIWHPYEGSAWMVWFGYSEKWVLTSLALGSNPGMDFLPEVTLADVVAAYGEPVRVGVEPDLRSVILLCYTQGMCVRTLTWGKPLLRPLTEIDTVNLFMPANRDDYVDQFGWRFAWRGFTGYIKQNIW